MVKQNVNDLSGLLRFIKQDGWEAEFEAVLAEHLGDVFPDAGFVSDPVKINVELIFRQLSPRTNVKSI